jgi:hypothetical protein
MGMAMIGSIDLDFMNSGVGIEQAGWLRSSGTWAIILLSSELQQIRKQ